MRRAIGIMLLLLGSAFSLRAAHIRGGEMFYEYLKDGSTATATRYRVTLKLYIDCNATSPGQLNDEVNFTIWRNLSGGNFDKLDTFLVHMTKEEFIRYDPNSNPCITNPPTDVCYRLRYYSTEVTLPNLANGYTIAFQRCCRIVGIQNMEAPSNSYGATYSCKIPGTDVLAGAYKNSSPQFNPNDAVAVCYGSNFSFDFSAVDPDRDPITGLKTDSIAYFLCNAHVGGGPSAGGANNCENCAAPNPTSRPEYSSIPYRSPYSGSQPMGLQATLNPKTGLLSGIAPNTEGQYVVTACAYEYRNKVLINIHRKDIHIRVADCVPLQALLKPDYAYCDDLLVTFRNEQVNPTGSVYTWDFGDGTPPASVTNIDGTIQHQYAAPGDYTVKLKVVLAGQCEDETTTLAKVWPGFNTDFRWEGSCILLPIKFFDQTTARYGSVVKWTWAFGDETTTNDVASTVNPSWQYGAIGMKTVRLISESSHGCKDTIDHQVEVKEKPTITLAFTDTLICSNRPVQDTLTLHASGLGIFSWTPLTDIRYQNTPDPEVWPATTTVYTVQLNENGCVNTANVRVRTIDRVTLNAGNDSTICLTDTISLKPITDALYFTWSSSPASPINNVNAKEPLVSPVAATTVYTVVGSVGKCNNTDAVSIFTIPYPTANAGLDTTICYQDTAQLHGSMIGHDFMWAPTATLSNPRVLDPLAFPLTTTSYLLRVTDILGCPKPRFDTVVVNVLPEIIAFAGNDTSIVTGQPLQLRGTGAALMEWTPSTYLSSARIANPVAYLNDHMSYQLRAYTPEGCFDLDTINIRVFKTNPDIFVPNGFKPGGSQNNVLRPILVGISQMEYFRVFNRWGQLVFQTSEHNRGWDGTLGGKNQPTGTYVWMVRGKDFTGKMVTKRGSAVLIR